MLTQFKSRMSKAKVLSPQLKFLVGGEEAEEGILQTLENITYDRSSVSTILPAIVRTIS